MCGWKIEDLEANDLEADVLEGNGLDAADLDADVLDADVLDADNLEAEDLDTVKLRPRVLTIQTISFRNRKIRPTHMKWAQPSTTSKGSNWKPSTPSISPSYFRNTGRKVIWGTPQT